MFVWLHSTTFCGIFQLRRARFSRHPFSHGTTSRSASHPVCSQLFAAMAAGWQQSASSIVSHDAGHVAATNLCHGHCVVLNIQMRMWPSPGLTNPHLDTHAHVPTLHSGCYKTLKRAEQHGSRPKINTHGHRLAGFNHLLGPCTWSEND